MMSIYSGLTVPDGHKDKRRHVNGEVIKIKYPEIVPHNNIYREAVEKTMY